MESLEQNLHYLKSVSEALRFLGKISGLGIFGRLLLVSVFLIGKTFLLRKGPES
jgi:hypothetical protein